MRARWRRLFTAEDGEVRRENDLWHGVMRGGRELAPDGSVANGFPPRSSAHSAVDKTPVRDASQRRCPKNIPNINHVRDASQTLGALRSRHAPCAPPSPPPRRGNVRARRHKESGRSSPRANATPDGSQSSTNGGSWDLGMRIRARMRAGEL